MDLPMSMYKLSFEHTLACMILISVHPPKQIIVHAPYITIHMNLIKRLETAQSSCLNRTSNLRASWPNKISLWVSYDSITTRAVPHLAYFSVKQKFCFVVQALHPIGYHCLSCSTATKINAHLPFSNSNEWKKLYVALHHHESYRSL